MMILISSRFRRSETDDPADDDETEAGHHGDCGERAQREHPNLVLCLVVHIALHDLVSLRTPDSRGRSRPGTAGDAHDRVTYFEKSAVCTGLDGRHRRAVSISASVAPRLRA